MSDRKNRFTLTRESPLPEADLRLIEAIQHGLAVSSRPYAEIARSLDMEEDEVIARLYALQQQGVIKRMGVVVRHRQLGYRANGMVVWDIPDDRVDELGHCMGKFEFVTLCYQRPRRLPEWPYNLFCMIHGCSRDAVLRNVELLERRCGLQGSAHKVLFSKRCFKQRGAVYRTGHGAGALRQCGDEQSVAVGASDSGIDEQPGVIPAGGHRKISGV